MTPEIVNLLFQTGMVGAFIFFALRMQKLNAEERAKRDGEWRLFLEEERKHRENGMTSGVDGLKEVVRSLEVHDRNAEQRVQAILEEVRKTA